jgi:hypothetical protein
MRPEPASAWTTVCTPHLSTLAQALEARDHHFEILSNDALRVTGIATDDLGWLAAGAGVVIYAMGPSNEE